MQEPRVVEALISRYRNLIVLAIVVVAQLLLLAWQVRTKHDVRLIRVWAVSAVTPMAGIVEGVRHNTLGFLEDYFILLDVREQNRRLRAENDRLKMDNIYYRNQLATAESARALSVFQAQSPSKTVAARVTGNGTVSAAQVVLIDRGSTSGVEDGMAVVTPDGVVGKVIAVYPLASQVLLVTDPTFAVGVESQKGHIHGTLHCNDATCVVENIQNEEKVDQGEWFYTSGEDRIFPKGFPVGTVSSVRPGQGNKEIHINLSGPGGSAEEVLVVLQGVHQQIPSAPAEQEVVKMLPPPPEDTPVSQQKPVLATEADKVKEKYEQIGKDEGHAYGTPGSNLPNFNSVPAAAPQTPAGGAGVPGTGTSGTAGTVGTAAAPATKTPVPPAILGERPQARTGAPATKRPAAVPQPGPALPLGAPRKKPVPPQP